jgi:hypothetical protein
MFPASTFEITPMEQLIQLARDQGHRDVTRLTARCGACDAAVLSNLGIAHESYCEDPKHIEFSRVESLRRKANHRR